MCGIAGLIGGEAPAEAVRGLCAAMVHRGPDEDGFFEAPGIALGMRRLSVIDLDHGRQPLLADDGRIVAFQNGEIYNYRQLRDQLIGAGYTFKTQSDTEVLAHGYHHWGIIELLRRLDGMYAVAILDQRSRTLHLARDRFGEKPLFYSGDGARFAFSSHLKGLARLPWVDRNIDPLALDHYLAVHYVGGDHSILRGVARVLPGERLEIPLDAPVPKRERYYTLPLNAPRAVSDDELARTMEDAVVSRLVADVPVGVFLSGGLDSSIVAAIAARHVPRIDTFSMGFHDADHDESQHAKAVAAAVNSNHHHFHFDENGFMDLLPKVAAALDEPVGDQAMLPVYWLAKEARQRVTVVLAGEGADEVFAGYGYYRGDAPHEISLLRRLLGRRGEAVIGANHQRFVYNPVPSTPSGFPLLADPADRQNLTGQSFPEPSPWEKEVVALLNGAHDPLQRATAADLLTWLPDDLLVKFDRMAMAHSLEGRAPFLSPAVVELGLALQARERMTRRAGSSKIALRRVAKRWLAPDILERKKQGFCLPMAAWLKQWFENMGGPKAWLTAHPVPGLDMDAAANLVAADLKAGVKRERLLFALVLLVQYWKSFDEP